MTPKCPDCTRDQDTCACVDKDERIKSLTAERDKLKDALENLIHLDDTSYLTQNWGLSSEQIKVICEALKESA